ERDEVPTIAHVPVADPRPRIGVAGVDGTCGTSRLDTRLVRVWRRAHVLLSAAPLCPESAISGVRCDLGIEPGRLLWCVWRTCFVDHFDIAGRGVVCTGALVWPTESAPS